MARADADRCVDPRRPASPEGPRRGESGRIDSSSEGPRRGPSDDESIRPVLSPHGPRIRSRSVAAGLLCLSLALLVVPVRAQTPAADSGQEQIQLGTTEVLFDFVATDGGKPITDLRPDEVVLTEDGVPQEITSLTRFDGKAPATTANGPAGGRAASDVAGSPLREFNLVMMVVDAGLDVTDSWQVRKAARAFVEKSMGPNDLVAVFQLGGADLMLRNFTNDKAALLETIDALEKNRRGLAEAANGYRPVFTAAVTRPPSASLGDTSAIETFLGSTRPGSEYDAVVDGALPPKEEIIPDLPGQKAHTSDPTVLRQRVVARSRLSQLFSLVNSYGKLRGRKAVVYFSYGLTALQIRDLEPLVDRVIGLANRNNVTFYTINPTGLAAPASASMDFSPLDHSSYNPVNVHLAERTGGTAAFNTNDLRRGFEDARRDMSCYYVASYAPKNVALDGSYRRVRVEVRRKGVRVRARVGYYATPAASVAWLPSETPLLEAGARAASGVRVDDFPVFALAPRLRAADGTWRVPVLFGVAGSGLTHEPGRADAYRFDTIATVRTADGDVAAEASRQTRLTDRAGALAKTTLRLAAFPNELALSAGRYTLTVVCHEPHTGKSSVLTEEIVVPEPPTSDAPATSGLALCSVAGVDGVRPFDPADWTAGAALYRPNVDGRFSAAAGRAYAFFRVYGKPGSKLAARVRVLRDGTEVASSVATLALSRAGDAVDARPLDLTKLAPGRYRVELTLVASDGHPLAPADTADLDVTP